MRKLKFEELKKGMKVKDEDGNVGIITLCKDIHNISVKYTNSEGGYGLYCIDPKCKTPIYDPLYVEE